MSQELIKDLIEALNHSPENIALKLRLAKCYAEIFEFENAENQLLEILRIDADHLKSKETLATVYYQQAKYSASIVVLEELIEKNPHQISLLELQCSNLLKLNEHKQAQEIYSSILKINSSYTNEAFDAVLRVTSNTQSNDENSIDEDALQFLKKSSIKFNDVGGMHHVKNEISLKIIKPLLHPELYKAYGKKIGGGILLYGPPGCGKTYIAKATAGEIDANFISVGINDILDMWMGNSESNLHEIFETARKNKPCVIFIDEIDALGANRNSMSNTAGRTVINQFLAELDGMNSENEGLLVLGATNTPWHLDPAFRRPGRFDRIIFVPPPDQEAREEIFKLSLKDKPIEKVDEKTLGKSSKSFSGADIKAVIDVAIEDKLQQSFATGNLEPLTMKALLKSIKKVKPSTKEWFTSAKNYALYSNDSGLYDDILTYLNIKK